MPDTRKNVSCTTFKLTSYNEKLNVTGRPEIELQQSHDLPPAADPDRCGAGRVFYG